MSFSARYVPAVMLTVFSLAATICAQSIATKTTKTPRGSVAGRVTIKNKGAAGVFVGLRHIESDLPAQPFLKATTDHDGFYRIGNLVSGTYEVTLWAPAYVIRDNHNQNSKRVIVAEDENVEGINFSLVRGGVITGKVTDADGRAVIQQQVLLYRAEQFEARPGQTRTPTATIGATTDDRGIYRMFGLAAGRYRVASGRAQDTFVQPFSSSRSTYHRVFHPDETDESRATVINVSEGSEANDVDILLGRQYPTFSASGKVIDSETGAPVQNIRFGLQRIVGPRFEAASPPVMVNVKGDFVIEGLAPGKYGVVLNQSLSQNQYPDLRAESFTFDIIDQDVTDLTIRLVKGGSLSGIVVLESDDKAVIQRFQQLQLRVFVRPATGTSSFGQWSISPIGPDGSFRLGGLTAGTANIVLSSQRGSIGMKGFAITRVEREGIVVPEGGIEVKDSEHLKGLRLTVAYGNASIRGVVKIENGTLPIDSQIFVRVTKPGENLSNLQPPIVDARGHFLIEGLQTGVYEVYVSLSGAAGHRNVKQSVTVQDGVVSDVIVTIDLSSTPR